MNSRNAAKDCCASSKPGAIPAMTSRPKNTVSSAMLPATQNITSRTRHVKRLALAAPSVLPCTLVQIGTQALLSAPWERRRRQKLTTCRAANNVSEYGPVPNRAAIQASRTYARTRDTWLPPPTVVISTAHDDLERP